MFEAGLKKEQDFWGGLLDVKGYDIV